MNKSALLTILFMTNFIAARMMAEPVELQWMDQWNIPRQSTTVDSEIEELTLYGPERERIFDIFGLEKLGKLRTLKISGYSWTLYSDRILPRIRNIRELIIDADAAEETWPRLSMLSRLEVFILRKNSGFVTELAFAPGVRLRFLALPRSRHLPKISGAQLIRVMDLTSSAIPLEDWSKMDQLLPATERIYLDWSESPLPQPLPAILKKEGILDYYRENLSLGSP